MDASHRSIEFSGLLVKHGQSNHCLHFIDLYVDKHTGKHLTGNRMRILLLTLHTRVRRQTYRKAPDRGQNEDIAADFALPPSGPHSTGGTANNFKIHLNLKYSSFHPCILYDIVFNVVYDIIGKNCEQGFCLCAF